VLKFSQVIGCILVGLNANILEACFRNTDVCLNDDEANHVRVFRMQGAPFKFLCICVMI